MPKKNMSKKQRGAMAASCHGKSTRGIPKEVGCEMLHGTKKPSKKRR